MAKNILEIKDLNVEYTSQNGILQEKQTVRAVNGLSLNVRRGEILAIAGESGCGKSTLAKTIARLETAKSGEILFHGIDILKLKKYKLKIYRQSMQMIFQNPYSSLNPKMKIIDILKEPLIINGELLTYSPDLTPLKEFEEEALNEIVKVVIKQVGLDEDALNLYPHEFSGGQRQRIAIARALILKPEFIIADEPVSALDVSIQAQIINLLLSLKQKFNLTFLFISHDLSVIRHIADRIAIMYLGEIVELGTVEEIFTSPKHPYTQALLNAVPEIDGKLSSDMLLKGDLPSPANLPTGCKFHTRCPVCSDICKEQQPQLLYTSAEHCTACFLNNL